MDGDKRLTTREAAARLGVKPETLYAYVSRGLIARERGPQGSTFRERDVEQLVRSSKRTKQLPALVFPSSVTLIDGDHAYYRGLDVTTLAADQSFEMVAEWLWRGSWPNEVAWRVDPRVRAVAADALAPLPAQALALDRFKTALAAGATVDPRRHDLTPDTVIATASGAIRLLVETLPPAHARRVSSQADAKRSVAEVLWSRLSPLPRSPARVAALNAALVLLADHELATSTLAVRSAAMVRADTYDVIGTGLNVAGGVRHGGASHELEVVLRSASEIGPARAVAERLAVGPLPGFGHPIYKTADPRARVLFERVAAIAKDPQRVEVVQGVLAAAASRRIPAHNVDAGLAALSWCAEMRPGSGEAIFAVARVAGWVAHALEQYEQPTFMRARVDFTGPRPPKEPAWVRADQPFE